jgi:type IV secretion system protein VirD4
MNATKILWGQVLLVSAVTLAFVWAATEWVAWRLAFQTQLGRPWFEFLGWPVYHPLDFFWWWFAYDAYARGTFVEGAYIASSGGIAAVVVAIAMSVWRAREAKRVTTYGSARWAETREVREAGLTAMMERCSADGATSICVMMGPSMSCVSRRPDPVRGSGLSSPRC